MEVTVIVALIAAGSSIASGTLVALWTYVAQRSNLRRQLDEAKRHQRVEFQHGAIVTFLAQADLLNIEASELWRCLTDPKLRHLADSIQARYYERWCSLREAYADIRVTGPGPASSASTDVVEKAYQLVVCVDALHRAGRASEPPPPEFASAAGACKGFATAANEALSISLMR